MTPPGVDEHTRLLGEPPSNAQSNGQSSSQNSNDNDEVEIVKFDEDDHGNPKQWPKFYKYLQVLLVFIIGLVLPMSSSILSPAINDIAEEFNKNSQLVLGTQSGFVCMLGIGPLFFAPMSETFGRRPIFLINLVLFTLIQIPTALAPNIEFLIVFRTLSGLFGSVGVANGGGTISDIFETHERATVLGFYLLGPLLGPTIGPFAAGLLISRYHWRALIWFTLIASTIVTTIVYFCLYETCGPIVLTQRKQRLEKENPDQKYEIEGQSSMSIWQKIAGNSTKAAKILTFQPIVLIMSAYQALIFSTMYSLYATFTQVWSNPPYNFDIVQVALTYLAPATGFILTALIVVPFIDRIYNGLAQKLNNGEGKPEYRLPLANIGAIFLPTALFWFGWTIEQGKPWPACLSAMLFFGASQVSIFNTVQNYYIDSFETMAASALAAGAFFRSIVGGIVPLFVPNLFESIGYGLGLSVFGGIAVLLMPAPLLFFWYGGKLRERFAVDK